MPIVPPIGPADPNLFALNWESVFEVLVTIIILSFILERALAMLFESSVYLRWAERRKASGKGDGKATIAFVCAAGGAAFWQFDAISVILVKDQATYLGAIATGAVIAGGSKGAIKLFHDVLDIKSEAYRTYATKTASPPAPKAETSAQTN